MGEYETNALRGELSATQNELWQLRSQVEQLTHVMRDVLGALQRANELAEEDALSKKAHP